MKLKERRNSLLYLVLAMGESFKKKEENDTDLLMWSPVFGAMFALKQLS